MQQKRAMLCCCLALPGSCKGCPEPGNTAHTVNALSSQAVVLNAIAQQSHQENKNKNNMNYLDVLSTFSNCLFSSHQSSQQLASETAARCQKVHDLIFHGCLGRDTVCWRKRLLCMHPAIRQQSHIRLTLVKHQTSVVKHQSSNDSRSVFAALIPIPLSCCLL